MKNFIRIASTALVAGTAALAAVAQSSIDDMASRTRTVTFDPAVTQTDAAAQELYQRLRSAARDVCVQEGYPRVFMDEDAKACATEAVDRAVRDANLSALTGVHVREGEMNAGAIEMK